MWGFLNIGSYDEPSAAFNYDFEFLAKVTDYAHSKCMKVISWWNPSYMMPYSEQFDDDHYENMR